MGVPIPLDQPPPSPEAEAPAGPVGAPISAGAAAITRGARRALAARGFVSLTEFRLPGGRRADLLAWDERGALLIVEVKSSIADFRSDHKWSEYREWCDGLFFAVDETFPTEILPADCGLMVADPFGAAVLREPATARLAPARRRSLIQRAALVAAARLHRVEDPLYTPALPTA